MIRGESVMLVGNAESHYFAIKLLTMALTPQSKSTMKWIYAHTLSLSHTHTHIHKHTHTNTHTYSTCLNLKSVTETAAGIA